MAELVPPTYSVQLGIAGLSPCYSIKVNGIEIPRTDWGIVLSDQTNLDVQNCSTNGRRFRRNLSGSPGFRTATFRLIPSNIEVAVVTIQFT